MQAYLQPLQASKMECFAQTVNGAPTGVGFIVSIQSKAH